MIFVIEVPAQAEPSAWFAFDMDDLMAKIEGRAPGLLEESVADTVPGAAGPLCRIFWNEAEATAAFERAGDPLWHGAGWRARLALREQLIALDVLADDL